MLFENFLRKEFESIAKHKEICQIKISPESCKNKTLNDEEFKTFLSRVSRTTDVYSFSFKNQHFHFVNTDQFQHEVFQSILNSNIKKSFWDWNMFCFETQEFCDVISVMNTKPISFIDWLFAYSNIITDQSEFISEFKIGVRNFFRFFLSVAFVSVFHNQNEITTKLKEHSNEMRNTFSIHPPRKKSKINSPFSVKNVRNRNSDLQSEPHKNNTPKRRHESEETDPPAPEEKESQQTDPQAPLKSHPPAPEEKQSQQTDPTPHEKNLIFEREKELKQQVLMLQNLLDQKDKEILALKYKAPSPTEMDSLSHDDLVKEIVRLKQEFMKLNAKINNVNLADTPFWDGTLESVEKLINTCQNLQEYFKHPLENETLVAEDFKSFIDILPQEIKTRDFRLQTILDGYLTARGTHPELLQKVQEKRVEFDESQKQSNKDAFDSLTSLVSEGGKLKTPDKLREENLSEAFIDRIFNENKCKYFYRLFDKQFNILNLRECDLVMIPKNLDYFEKRALFHMCPKSSNKPYVQKFLETNYENYLVAIKQKDLKRDKTFSLTRADEYAIWLKHNTKRFQDDNKAIKTMIPIEFVKEIKNKVSEKFLNTQVLDHNILSLCSTPGLDRALSKRIIYCYKFFDYVYSEIKEGILFQENYFERLDMYELRALFNEIPDKNETLKQSVFQNLIFKADVRNAAYLSVFYDYSNQEKFKEAFDHVTKIVKREYLEDLNKSGLNNLMIERIKKYRTFFKYLYNLNENKTETSWAKDLDFREKNALMLKLKNSDYDLKNLIRKSLKTSDSMICATAYKEDDEKLSQAQALKTNYDEIILCTKKLKLDFTNRFVDEKWFFDFLKNNEPDFNANAIQNVIQKLPTKLDKTEIDALIFKVPEQFKDQLRVECEKRQEEIYIQAMFKMIPVKTSKITYGYGDLKPL
jgi:DNA-directed RNA polymerase subunit L